MKILMGLVLAVGMLGCTGGATSRVTKLVGGPASLAVLQNPDRVVAQRIRTDADDGFKEKTISELIDVPAELVGQFQKVLLSDASYEWDLAKGCIPMPGVLLVFSKGQERSEVRLCFECNIVLFEPGHSEDFDRMRPQLAAICKKLFPKDPVIQGLE